MRRALWPPYMVYPSHHAMAWCLSELLPSVTRYNATSKMSTWVPPELQRVMLRRVAAHSPTVRHGGTPPTKRLPVECLLSWAGAVRGNNNQVINLKTNKPQPKPLPTPQP